MPNKEVGDEFEALMRESARVAAEYDSSESDELVDPTLELSSDMPYGVLRVFQLNSKISPRPNTDSYN